MKSAFIAVISFLLVGCLDEKAMIQKFAPRDDDEFARKFIELVRQAEYSDAERMLDPAVTAKIGAAPLSQFHDILNHGEPLAFELIGANAGFFRPWNGSESKRQVNLTYQIQFRDAWIVAAFVIESSSGGKHISTVNLQPVSDSLRVLNRFTLNNKSPLQYLFLLTCILVPLFIIATVVICLCSSVRRRWLWIIFILFGIMQLQLNWTTGETGLQPISFLLLGASFFRSSSYAAIVFSFGIPVGAIVFLALRRWLRRNDESPPLPTAPA